MDMGQTWDKFVVTEARLARKAKHWLLKVFCVLSWLSLCKISLDVRTLCNQLFNFVFKGEM